MTTLDHAMTWIVAVIAAGFIAYMLREVCLAIPDQLFNALAQ